MPKVRPTPARHVRETRLPDMRVADAFFDAWTPSSAWVLGLLFGDGHIQYVAGKTYRIFILGTEQVLRAVAALLGHARGPCRKIGCQNVWELRWSSWRMVESLITMFGLHGDKADRIYIPDMPDALVPHFVRGLWDSDGSWYSRGNYRHAIYTSTSERVIQQLQLRYGGSVRAKPLDRPGVLVNGRLVVGRRQAWDLVLRRDETRRLVRCIYADTTPDLRCERKYAIARVALEPNLGTHSPDIPDPTTRRYRARITRGEVRRMVDLYSTGLASDAVAAETQRDPRSVRMHLARVGILRRREIDKVSEDVMRDRIQGLELEEYERARKSWEPGFVCFSEFKRVYGKTFAEVRDGKPRDYKVPVDVLWEKIQGIPVPRYEKERKSFGPGFPAATTFKRIYGMQYGALRDGPRPSP